MAWFGDLDPQALHWFATLRAGSGPDLLRSLRHRHAVAYIGMDSTWLRWVERNTKSLRWLTIDMCHVDREYWKIVQTLVPDLRSLLGERACAFLDSGRKLEVDGLIGSHRRAFLREIGRRVEAIAR